MDRRVLYWEVSSAAIIIMLGFIFHFAFSWTNEWRPAALLFSVNESVWEHCKIGFWPAVLFTSVEYFFIGRQTNNFWVAKAALTLVIPVAIIDLFYTYTGIIGYNLLPIDIGIFFVAVFLAQLLSYKLLKHQPLPAYFRIAAIAVIIILTISFAALTFNPGSLPLFIDAHSGTAGIP